MPGSQGLSHPALSGSSVTNSPVSPHSQLADPTAPTGPQGPTSTCPHPTIQLTPRPSTAEQKHNVVISSVGDEE